MTHTVKILVSEYQPIIPCKEQLEAELWLLDNAKGNWKSYIARTDVAGEYGVDFHFSNPQDAMLFKLTWGGK